MIKIKLEDWVQDGEGNSAVTYYKKDDPTKLLKLFKETVRRDFAISEFERTNNVNKIGVKSAKVYDFAECGDRFGIVCERILGKISISRKIANNPETLEHEIKVFAKMCKELHAIEDTRHIFPDYKKNVETYIRGIEDKIGSKKVNILLDLLKTVPESDNCVHGDMHTGNMITTGDKYYWIDFGDFSRGSNIFDIGVFYFITKVVSFDPLCQEIFHLNQEQLLKCWHEFAKNYFDVESEEDIEAATEKIRPYSVFFPVTCIYLFGGHGPDYGYIDAITSELEKKQNA